MSTKRCLVVLALFGGLAVPTHGLSAQPQADPPCDLDGDGFGDLAWGVQWATVSGEHDAGHVEVSYGTADGLPSSPDEVWSQDSPGIRQTAEASDQFGASVTCGDFNGDGFDDLGIGVPTESLPGPTMWAGAVNVIYGSAGGLTAAGDQVFHQDSTGVKDRAEEGDRFGQTTVSGDFNGDGFDDLGIGVFWEDIGAIMDAGAVNVIYGSPDGLDAGLDDFWHQNRSGVKDSSEFHDQFGLSLTAGDFDGSGEDDLVIGVPGEDIGTIMDAGAANVIYGSPDGLDAGPDDFWHQNRSGIKEAAEAGEFFGFKVTAGDFNGDGNDDVAFGVQSESRGQRDEDGVVNVIYGSGSGLTAAADQLWHQNRSGVKGSPRSFDELGTAVAAGDFDGDGFHDLAIGVPGKRRDGFDGVGVVNVLYGADGGLQAGNDDLWHQDRPGVMSRAAPGEYFGVELVTNDYDGNARGDLMILSVRDDPALAGNLLFGRPGGLSAVGDQYLILG